MNNNYNRNDNSVIVMWLCDISKLLMIYRVAIFLVYYDFFLFTYYYYFFVFPWTRSKHLQTPLHLYPKWTNLLCINITNISIYILYIYSDTTPHIRNAAIAQRHLSPLCAHLQRDQYCLFGLWSSGTVSLKTTKHNHPVTRYFRHSLLSIAVRLSTYRKLITYISTHCFVKRALNTPFSCQTVRL